MNIDNVKTSTFKTIIENIDDELETVEVEICELDIPELIDTRSCNTELRIYRDGTVSVESGLNSDEDCVYAIENVDTDTLVALGYEPILDDNGDDTDQLEFTGSFEEFMYFLNT